MSQRTHTIKQGVVKSTAKNKIATTCRHTNVDNTNSANYVALQ